MTGWLLMLALVALAGHAGAHGAARSQVRWPLWTTFKARYMTRDGRIIVRKAKDLRTVSEGQAYAMFLALVADDRPAFERLLDWTRVHLAGGDMRRRLPAWWWGHRANGSWGIKGRRSAADADLWIAYSLIEAARLWKFPPWRAMGIQMAHLVAEQEVIRPRPQFNLLLGGNRGFVTTQGYLFNPSYEPLPILLNLARVVPSGPWATLAYDLPRQLQAVCTEGRCPDWAMWVPGLGYRPAPQKGGVGSWDAIRIYLWAGLTDPRSPGRNAILNATSGMGRFIARQGVVPLRLDVRSGRGSGVAPVGFLAAVLPDLKALGEHGAFASIAARLRAFRLRDGLYARPPSYHPRYYQTVLILFAKGFLHGRYRFGPDGRLLVPWASSGRTSKGRALNRSRSVPN